LSNVGRGAPSHRTMTSFLFIGDATTAWSRYPDQVSACHPSQDNA
jgi:hypothetical protein